MISGDLKAYLLVFDELPLSPQRFLPYFYKGAYTANRISFLHKCLCWSLVTFS